IPLDDEQRWYRYHHLFADLIRDLQNTRQKDETAELHRRASIWYAHAGMASEAIQHALAAADYAMAVHLVESHAMGMILRGYVKTVEGWMQTIPPEWGSLSPKTNMAFAWMHLLRGDYAQASPYLERAQAAFSGPQMRPHLGDEDTSLKAEWLALQSTVLNAQEKPIESLALANRALEMAAEKDHYVRGLIYLGLADAYQQMDDYVHAVDAFQMIVHHGRAAANFLVELLGLTGLSAMALRHGQLHLALEIASQGVERVERSGSLPPISAAIYGELGQVYYQWNQLEQAHRFFQRATQVSTLSGYNDAAIMYAVIRSRLYQVEGDLEASAREIQEAVDLLQSGAPAWVRSEVISQQVRLHLARDNPVAAEMVLRQSGVSIQDEVSHKTDLIHIAYLRLMLYRGQDHQNDKLRQASELARRIIASAEAGQRVETALQTLIISALVRSSSGDTKGSLELLDQALGLAEPEGYVLLFLEEGPAVIPLLRAVLNHPPGTDRVKGYARKLLDAFPGYGKPVAPRARRPVKVAGLVEPLTPRELEVLQLVAAGDSNRTIADKLVITVSAVKKHNSNIFGKLNVNSRTQAIARARQLGLLPADG
ncbi:MAG: LuxR C-terminal-related transcriptional regulator, partial [Chloroflexota bacterium]|nr:LuxR C-terminal-related transcriptional regulator [Chloroflexota bacterium]